MTVFNPDVLSVIGEAVVIARGGKISFLNTPAAAILGAGAMGKRLSAVFGTDIVGTQAGDFTANVCLNGKNCIIRSSKRNGEQILVLNEVKFNSSVINDSFLCSLRSSLMVMKLSVECCRKCAEASGSEELSAAADAMSKSLSCASRLAANVSAVCAIESKTLRFSPKTQDISRLFSEYADIAAALLPDVKISFEAPDGLQAAVDDDLMKHLLTNLISNSVLHGKCRKLRIRLIDSTENVFLAVNDDGGGIRSEELYNVFERYLGTMQLADISRGAGLGLTVVMGIAQLHGGTVLLESRPEHGTAVRVSLNKKSGGTALYSPSITPEDTQDILTGLSDCVDEKRFREVYRV